MFWNLYSIYTDTVVYLKQAIFIILIFNIIIFKFTSTIFDAKHQKNIKCELKQINCFQDFYTQQLAILHHQTAVTPSGCVVWLGCGSQKYGRKRVKFPGDHASRLVYTHRLCYMLTHRLQQLPENIEISHLCHTPRCIRIDHLVPEPRATNADRLTCNLQRVCTKNHYPHCLI